MTNRIIIVISASHFQIHPPTEQNKRALYFVNDFQDFRAFVIRIFKALISIYNFLSIDELL